MVNGPASGDEVRKLLVYFSVLKFCSIGRLVMSLLKELSWTGYAEEGKVLRAGSVCAYMYVSLLYTEVLRYIYSAECAINPNRKAADFVAQGEAT